MVEYISNLETNIKNSTLIMVITNIETIKTIIVQKITGSLLDKH